MSNCLLVQIESVAKDTISRSMPVYAQNCTIEHCKISDKDKNPFY